MSRVKSCTWSLVFLIIIGTAMANYRIRGYNENNDEKNLSEDQKDRDELSRLIFIHRRAGYKPYNAADPMLFSDRPVGVRMRFGRSIPNYRDGLLARLLSESSSGNNRKNRYFSNNRQD